MTSEPKSGVAEFRKGEIVSGLGVNSGKRRVGKFLGYYDDGNGKIEDPDDTPWAVRPDSLRHEPAEEQKAFYGEMPKVLPATLPAGTRFCSAGATRQTPFTWLMVEDGVLHADGYICRFKSIDGGQVHDKGRALVQNIDWSTVPLPASTPPARCDFICPDGKRCEASGVHSMHVTSVTLPVPDFPKPSEPVRGAPSSSRPNADTAKHAAWMLEQDRIHASKMRQAKEMLDRPLPVRTGALLDRDKYGQRLALHGWDSDDV